MKFVLVSVFALLSALGLVAGQYAYMNSGSGGYGPASTSYLPYVGGMVMLLLVLMYYLNNRKGNLYVNNQSLGVQLNVG